MNAALAAALSGFALGWSVAWPPGPINAEIARRALTRGFAGAFAVGLGASSGDFVWALAVGLGAGALAASPAISSALPATSIVLLLGLSAHYLAGALRRWRRRAQAAAAPARLDTTRGGYALGLVMALTSPFNIAFWLAVIGRPEISGRGIDLVLIMAASVIGGTLTWITVLSASVVLLRARYNSPVWDIATRAATGALLAGFAISALA